MLIKRPMLAIAGAWLLGILLTGLRFLWIAFVIFLYAICVAILLFLIYKKPSLLSSFLSPKRYAPLTILLLLLPTLFFLGWFRGTKFEASVQKDVLAYEQMLQDGETKLILTGTISKMQRDTERLCLTMTDCVVSGFEQMQERSSGGCLVYLSLSEQETLVSQLKVGNQLRVYGSFRMYRDASNPGQFQAFRYYACQGVYAGVTAIKVDVLSSDVHILGQSMYYLRKWMTDSYQRVFGDSDAGVLSAMLIGDKTLLLEETEELYQKNGISHILAISGMHISLLCLGLYRLFCKVGVPRKLNLLLSLAFLLFYVCYSGGSTSAWRAAIMGMTLLLSYQCRRSYDMISALSLSAILITAVTPWEVSNVGFLLSFGAVFGVAAAIKVQEKLPKICAHFVFSIIISCVTTPLSLWFFYEFSPYSILVNVLIIPMSSILMVCGLLAGFLGIFFTPAAALFAGVTHLILGWYENLAEFTQTLPYSYYLLGRPEVWQLFFYTLFVLLAGIFLFKSYRLAAGLLFVSAWLCLLMPKQQDFKLTFFDVSQGDGIVCSTKEEVLLFDCGSSDVSEVATYRVIPYLKQQGIGIIHIATLSHMDVDHMSGIKEILENMQPYEGRQNFVRDYDGSVAIEMLVLPKVDQPSDSYLELVALAKEKQVSVQYFEAGDSLCLLDQDVTVSCLSPEHATESENETSLVFYLTYRDLRVWLMGDAGMETEKQLLESKKDILDSETNIDEVQNSKQQSQYFTILKVGHHGSNSSSSNEFIMAVKPDVSIISCGLNNRYGHPHDEVVERLQSIETKIVRTDLQGAITVSYYGDEPILTSFLQNNY